MEFPHFNHHHPLIPLKLDEGEKLKCDACEQAIVPPFHGCIPCEYHLHDKCLKAPRWLKHPFHPSHSLTLFSSPTYTSREFNCEACGASGGAFGYSCAECEVDLHLHCTNLPSAVAINAHPHELKLTFKFPQGENASFLCDVCEGELDCTYWMYYCADCDFGTHLLCGAPTHMPGLLESEDADQTTGSNAKQSSQRAALEEAEESEIKPETALLMSFILNYFPIA